jgi:glutamyl-tRNA reductase
VFAGAYSRFPEAAAKIMDQLGTLQSAAATTAMAARRSTTRAPSAVSVATTAVEMAYRPLKSTVGALLVKSDTADTS